MKRPPKWLVIAALALVWIGVLVWITAPARAQGSSPLMRLPGPPDRITLAFADLPDKPTITAEIDASGSSWMVKSIDDDGADLYHTMLTVTGHEFAGWPQNDADLNGDGRVDNLDLAAVLAAWGTPAADAGEGE